MTMKEPSISTAMPDVERMPDRFAAAPVIIEVDHLYKQFTRAESRASLREETGSAIRRVLGLAVPPRDRGEFYALHDVSFRVRQGESIVIFGRNGSGKTTLLRLLSGVTRPTRGSVRVTGRYASLIALGAGFNPEMSGRENIYLNAAIYGVEPKQIQPLIPEIIAFSELDRFIDMPVKLYSSGMYARLGFSVAIHILPDIIFVDEILAVGDVAFQKKCNLRIKALRDEGRTFVIVSHNITGLEPLVDRALWLNDGHLMMDGPLHAVWKAYQSFAMRG
jgi:lipopolysaccharide transport system ATP-binding protein